jgi:hypothetical protein
MRARVLAVCAMCVVRVCALCVVCVCVVCVVCVVCCVCGVFVCVCCVVGRAFFDLAGAGEDWEASALSILHARAKTGKPLLCPVLHKLC